MAYRFSKVKRIISALLLGLLVVLLIVRFWPWHISAPESPQNGSIYKYPQNLSKAAYGVNVDITAMIPGTPYTVKTANGGNFFDLAAQLGINTLRITDVRWAITGKVRSEATWRYVFDEAANHHMNIILLLIDGGNHGQYTAVQEAHTLLNDYGLAHAPALWMVDLDDEPDLSNPQQMAELRQEAAYVRQVAPSVPITIGGWKSEIQGHPGEFDWQDPADIPKLIDLVDIISPHLYGFDQAAKHGIPPRQSTRNFLTEVRKEAQGKSILLGEFGEGNGLATTTESTPTGSPEWQASVYRGVLQEVSAEQNQGVIGAVAWIIAPRPAFPNATNYEGDMTGWAFVLNHGQQLLPAAEEFSSIEHIQ